MKKKKKLLYGLGAMVVLAAPIATIISCGSSKGDEVYKGEHSTIYRNKETKTLTFEIGLGDTIVVDEAEKYMKASDSEMNEFFVSEEGKKILLEDNKELVITINSRGKTASKSMKNEKDEDTQRKNTISILVECGWKENEANQITSG